MTTKQILALIAIMLALLSIILSIWSNCIYAKWIKLLKSKNKKEDDSNGKGNGEK